jgi:hypothetical protein
MGDAIRVQSHVLYQLSCVRVARLVDGIVEKELGLSFLGVSLDRHGDRGARDDGAVSHFHDEKRAVGKSERFSNRLGHNNRAARPNSNGFGSHGQSSIRPDHIRVSDNLIL